MWRSDYNSDGDGIVLILDFAEILCAKTLPSSLKKKKKLQGLTFCDGIAGVFRSSTLGAEFVMMPIPSSPGRRSGENLEMVIMTPVSTTLASLVRNRFRELSLRSSGAVHGLDESGRGKARTDIVINEQT